jgi:hypothetical protein
MLIAEWLFMKLVNMSCSQKKLKSGIFTIQKTKDDYLMTTLMRDI